MVSATVIPVGEVFSRPLAEGLQGAFVVGQGARRDVLLDREKLEELLSQGIRFGWEHDGLGALWAGAKEFKFMVEIPVSGVLPDLLFQFVHRAGGIDGGDGAALGADQVVAVLAGKNEGKVGGTLVQPEATDDASVGQAMEEPVDGGLVTLGGKRA